MDIAMLRLLVLPASAVVAVCIGLAGAGLNVLKIVQLSGLRKALSIVAGACGLLTLAFYFMDATDPVFAQFHVEGHMINLVTALGCGVIALSVGAASLGFNVLKAINMNSARRVLEFIAGLFGAYGLILYFR